MKPTLRTETPTECRLKRQLRRFITAYHRARLHPLAVDVTLYPWVLACEIGMIPLSVGIEYDANTPQERLLASVCIDIRHLIRTSRRSQVALLSNCVYLVCWCKDALRQTRRDKEMTS